MKMKGGEPIQVNGRAGQGVHVKLETVPMTDHRETWIGTELEQKRR